MDLPRMTGTRREFPHGTVTDIFNSECASLVVMNISNDDDQSLAVMRVGGFVINLYVHAVTHLMMTTCCINDLQWPLSRDSTVVRAGERSFAFLMLGLLYGIQLPPVCEDMVDTLERVFMKFGDYIALEHGENGYPCPDNEPTFWATVRPVIVNIARARLGNNWRLMIGNEATTLSKVIRASTTTKIISSAILTGFLKPLHVEMFTIKMKDQRKRDVDSEDVFSSILAITDIVNSFAMVREIPVGDPPVPQVAGEDDGSATTSQNKLWKLNQLGMSLFLVKNRNLYIRPI